MPTEAIAAQRGTMCARFWKPYKMTDDAPQTTPLERLAAEAVVLAGGDHPCGVLGHRWVFAGSRNCGCGHDACSVPVHECEACGDCDYGDNADADETRERCTYG